MSEEVTGSTTAAAFIANQGSSAVFGMIGAVILYLVLPPVDNNGKFDRKEFALRLLVAGLFSIFFGDMLASTLQHFVPWLEPLKNKSAVDLLAGAPGWWVSRAAALWFHKRHDKDISEIIKEVKENRDQNGSPE
jgi:hypothetical protein